mmetsp:Transcript_578/g.1346  ORF Transcript_578/g.1346 Transcript_578/m.1346 type:complete len:202 (-) Transcript_578:792-1397(-)
MASKSSKALSCAASNLSMSSPTTVAPSSKRGCAGIKMASTVMDCTDAAFPADVSSAKSLPLTSNDVGKPSDARRGSTRYRCCESIYSLMTTCLPLKRGSLVIFCSRQIVPGAMVAVVVVVEDDDVSATVTGLCCFRMVSSTRLVKKVSTLYIQSAVCFTNNKACSISWLRRGVLAVSRLIANCAATPAPAPAPAPPSCSSC